MKWHVVIRRRAWRVMETMVRPGRSLALQIMRTLRLRPCLFYIIVAFTSTTLFLLFYQLVVVIYTYQ